MEARCNRLLYGGLSYIERLYIMVRLIEELAKLDAPIVFKDAMVLKTALSGYPLNTERTTRDIDGDWVGNPPSMEYLNNIINTALSRIGPTYTSTPYREYGQGKSAGFTIHDNGEEIFTIDLSIKQNPYSIYYTTFNGVQFVGASPQKMFVEPFILKSSGNLTWNGNDWI